MSNSLQSSIGESISLELRLQEDLELVQADPSQIEQVVLNLATNARDAMPNGGTLTIETANVLLDETSAVGTLGTMTGPHVTLTVTDSGTGIPSDIIEHVFEPFFTTKEVGKGTGLGLAAVYGIVKQSGGDIHLYSEPGLGTSFRIYLPQANGDPTDLDAIERTGTLPRGRETVLIIENLDNVRTLATRVLTDLGYTVLVAQHGADALHMCQSEHAYMSGYTDSEMAVRGILEPGARFLQKPFTGKMLADKVRQELDRRAHAEDIIESSSHKA